MKYLKKYGSIKESTMGDLSFEDFQDILTDITDKYDFKFSFDEDKKSYDFWIFFDVSSIHIKEDGFGFIREYLPETINDTLECVGEKNADLESAKENIDKMVSLNKKLINILNELQKYIIPRFKSFSNCESVVIEYEEDAILIQFIKS
jgi:hypothetical protein